jgi:hypothetical protein
MAKIITSMIVRDFCTTIREHLKPLVIKRLITSSIRRMVNEFEVVQGVPYFFKVIDGSHIPIIAPCIDLASYYCRKGFY